MSVWFITGAARGFGREIAREALARGHRVAATARNPDDITAALGEHPDLLPVALDVTDADQVDVAVAAVIDRFGTIDVLVNNAGRGLVGAVEETSDDDARTVFDVNVFGLLAVTRAVLPVMRHNRSGKIINISSSGGFVGRAGFGIYCATKFAVEGLSESLAAEVTPLGIGVTAIEPGGFRTDALDDSSLLTVGTAIDDYDTTAGETRRTVVRNNHNQPGDPAKAAHAILDLDALPVLTARIQLGADCFGLVADKITRVRDEQLAWETVSTSTAFDTA
jgi:NAD(P)-dependent dehydrogenase (short-subunit alcohol dehydrogenase family)